MEQEKLTIIHINLPKTVCGLKAMYVGIGP